MTGQIATTFEENPQVPFEDLDLNVFDGPRATLRTPPTCGPKATAAIFTPWSAPESGPPVKPGRQLRNHHRARSAGVARRRRRTMLNAPKIVRRHRHAQGRRLLALRLQVPRRRHPGNQGLNAALPPGLTGRLAGVADARRPARRGPGPEKPGEASPRARLPELPGARSGRSAVGAGAGPSPFYAPPARPTSRAPTRAPR